MRMVWYVCLLALGLPACSSPEAPYETYVPEYTVKKVPVARLLDEHPIEVVVHRGANHLAPENTFASAVKAIELGVDYVEIDVQISKDGVHYLMHDITLGRTTNGWGPLRLRPSSYIDGLDAGSWFSQEYAGERVPRLEEYLLWIKGKAKVYLDVKTANLPEVIEIIRNLEMEEDTFFWFWNSSMMRRFRRLAPDLKLKVNAHTPEEVKEVKEAFHADIIECDVREITPELVQICQELDISIMAYVTNNTLKEFRRVIESEADMVNLDRPELYLEVLKSVKDSLALSE